MTTRATFLTLALLALVGPCTPAGAGVTVPIHVQAGPVCPVEREPSDPACADRPVADAEIVVTDASGRCVTSGRSNADGNLTLALPTGSYLLTPQPVEGILGTARPTPFEVSAQASQAPVVIVYDTGIR